MKNSGILLPVSAFLLAMELAILEMFLLSLSIGLEKDTLITGKFFRLILLDPVIHHI